VADREMVIHVPFWLELRRKSGWHTAGPQKFFAVRLHLRLVADQRVDSADLLLDAQTMPANSTLSIGRRLVPQLDADKSLRQLFARQKPLQDWARECFYPQVQTRAAYEIGSAERTRLTEALRDAFNEMNGTHRGCAGLSHKRSTTGPTMKAADSDRSVEVMVRAHKERWAVTVDTVDYLTVASGLRGWKKLPKADGKDDGRWYERRSNVIRRLNAGLGSVSFWQSTLVLNVRTAGGNPTGISCADLKALTIGGLPPVSLPQYPADLSDARSLYQLAQYWTNPVS
jgi:hypothetical protein